MLFIVPTLRGGGAERVIVTLLRHLDPARFRMVLGVVDASQAVYRGDVPDHVGFVDLGCARMRHATWKVLRLIWRVRPDLVFSTLANLNLTVAALRPAMPRGTALIGREGTIVSEGIRSFRRRSLWFAGYRVFYPRFDAVVCQSRYMRDDLVEHHGMPREKTVVINNPIDLERIARGLPAQRRPRRAVGGPLRLVAAGRFGPEKGYDLLLEAIALVPELEISLSILGDGLLVPEVKRRAAELGLAHAVALVGFQPNPIPYFADADAFVLSSRYEGFPNVVLEALACDIGVIATPALGGTPEILEGLAGCELASEISAPALAAAIRAWASRPFRGIAPAVLDRYRGSEIAEQYARLFERVCDARQQR